MPGWRWREFKLQGEILSYTVPAQGTSLLSASSRRRSSTAGGSVHLQGCTVDLGNTIETAAYSFSIGVPAHSYRTTAGQKRVQTAVMWNLAAASYAERNAWTTALALASKRTAPSATAAAAMRNDHAADSSLALTTDADSSNDDVTAGDADVNEVQTTLLYPSHMSAASENISSGSASRSSSRHAAQHDDKATTVHNAVDHSSSTSNISSSSSSATSSSKCDSFAEAVKAKVSQAIVQTLEDASSSTSTSEWHPFVSKSFTKHGITAHKKDTSGTVVYCKGEGTIHKQTPQ
jgi:hypothetical protein